MTRRDLCHLIGKRAALLPPNQAALAWQSLAEHLRDELGMMPLPKFKHLLRAVRTATIAVQMGTRTGTVTAEADYQKPPAPKGA